MTASRGDRRRARAVRVLAVGAVLAASLGIGSASASQLGVGATDGVASGVATATTCDTSAITTAPVFDGDNPTRALTGVTVSGIPASCADAEVLVVGRDAASDLLVSGRAQHTGTGTVTITGFAPVTATRIVTLTVTLL